MSKQKNKGNYYENKIANITKSILGLEPYECKRASSSGNEAFEFADIYFTNPKKYSIILECKFHNDWDFRSLWPSVNAKFLKFLEEIEEANLKYQKTFNKDPIFCGVVFSKPYYKNFVLTWYEFNIPRMICENKFKNRELYVYEFEKSIYFVKDMITGGE